MGWGAMFLRRTKLYLLPAIVLFWSAALAAQLRQIGIIDMPGHPGFGAVAFAGNYLVITHPGADTLDIFDPSSIGQPFAPSPAGLALRVPDVDEARSELESKGVQFEGDTVDTGVCHMAFFHDPDGNALMLHRRYAPRDQG